MAWSWRLGRVSGIDVRIHWTFLLLLAWIGAAYLMAGESVAGAARGIAVILSFFVCIVLHEFGHAFVGRRFGVRTRDITLLPIGGVARFEEIPERPRAEFWIAVAGPAVNVAIAAVLASTLWLSGGLGDATAVESLATAPFLPTLLAFNVVVVLFNMLPAFPMDGGRVLRAALATRTSYVRATRVAANTGQLMAIAFGLIGLLINPLLLFIALFVYLGAEAEARSVEMRAAIDSVPVREAMMTQFRTLTPDDSLRDAANELIAGAQTDFPVVRDGRLVGLLTRSEIVRGIDQGGAETLVRDVMTESDEHASGAEKVDAVLTRMKTAEREAMHGLLEGVADLTAMPVVHNGDVIGLLTLQNIGELVMVRAALRDEGTAPDDVEQLIGAA